MPLSIVGLGPGPRDLLTREAEIALGSAGRVVFRTRRHPIVDHLDLATPTSSFDEVYEHGGDFQAVYDTIVARLVELAAAPEPTVYAVPGHPLVGEATVRGLLQLRPDTPVIAGISFLEPVLTATGIDPLESATLVSDALTPAVHPDAVAVYAQVYDRAIASDLKLALLRCYPAGHRIAIVRYGAPVEWVPLEALDRGTTIDHLTTVVVPRLPLEAAAGSFEAIYEVVRRLRAPDGCPWDRAQTHESITRYLVEECYEAIDALESGDKATFAEELGDVLLQVLLHAQIADDNGDFDIHDVMAAITRKLVRRHPHVFGDRIVSGADEVVANWDALKKEERDETESILESVPRSMPALAQAQGLQERAARVGFDWDRPDQGIDKVEEELCELRAARDPDEWFHELRDLLFTLVNLARWQGVESEAALRAAAARFRQRFGYVEDQARHRGIALDTAGLDQLERWWQEAKELEHQPAQRPPR